MQGVADNTRVQQQIQPVPSTVQDGLQDLYAFRSYPAVRSIRLALFITCNQIDNTYRHLQNHTYYISNDDLHQ